MRAPAARSTQAKLRRVLPAGVMPLARCGIATMAASFTSVVEIVPGSSVRTPAGPTMSV